MGESTWILVHGLKDWQALNAPREKTGTRGFVTDFESHQDISTRGVRRELWEDHFPSDKTPQTRNYLLDLLNTWRPVLATCLSQEGG